MRRNYNISKCNSIRILKNIYNIEIFIKFTNLIKSDANVFKILLATHGKIRI
jgi:hypothetical protein